MFTGNSRAIFNRLDRADLVVGMHDAHKDRARCNRFAKFVWVNPASSVNRKIGQPRAQAFEKPARFDDRRVLDPSGDDVIALVAKSKIRALESEIVGLTATAGENDLIVVATEQSCDLAACYIKRSLCFSRSLMATRRIAVMIVKKSVHRSGDGRIDWRACVVIQINALHWTSRRMNNAVIVLQCGPLLALHQERRATVRA